MNDADDVKVEYTKKTRKSRKFNRWGLLFSLIFIAVGLIWYGVNLGIIPYELLLEQAGPIILIIIGLLILVKSF
ncbi:MAG TPA: hypothetical protein PKI66_09240 [Methanobacteriaceae archaeon]|jgi:hypothetical protein|nr:hypothetical protein [Euryarchaeota archaeon]HNR26883.1 hypothetical protein [Methanobacteriaceae archaeon]